MKRDLLNDTLVAIKNAEAVGKQELSVAPSSKLLKSVLDIMRDSGYIAEYKETEDTRGGSLTINLNHKLNKCGVIKPRFSVKRDDYEKWEQRYLPAADFGILIISTSQGLMTHYDSKKKEIGGRLIAYVY